MATFVPKKEMLLCPSGTIQAVCYDFWDIGEQKTEWKGKTIIQPKCIFAFELNKPITDGALKGQRYRINKRYTLSLEKKARLKADMESWRGQSFNSTDKYTFDLENMVGENCLLSIIHDNSSGDTYANISTIMKLPEGMSPIEPVTQRSIPDWVKELKHKLGNSEEDDGEVHF